MGDCFSIYILSLFSLGASNFKMKASMGVAESKILFRALLEWKILYRILQLKKRKENKKNQGWTYLFN